MAKVLGLGGLFFKSPNPAALRAWYAQWLGLEADEYGANFSPQTMPAGARTVWCAVRAVDRVLRACRPKTRFTSSTWDDGSRLRDADRVAAQRSPRRRRARLRQPADGRVVGARACALAAVPGDDARRSTFAVGIIEGVAEGTAMIVKVFSGYVSDVTRRRKPLVLLGYGLAARLQACVSACRPRLAGSSARASSIASARASAARRVTR